MQRTHTHVFIQVLKLTQTQHLHAKLTQALSLYNRLTRNKPHTTARQLQTPPRPCWVSATPNAKKIVKGRIKEKNRSKRRRLWWGWALVGPVMAALLVTAITTSNTGSKISFFNNTQRSCHCPPQTSGRYTGMVEDCCCDYETVNRLNQEVLQPLLEEIVKTPFFRYFKVKLWCDCPFWRNDGMCHLRDCSVCECPENEFPANFKKPFRHRLPSNIFLCQEGKPDENVDRTLDSGSFKGWIESDNPWTNENEFDSGEMSYVNLLLNPERYTGYAGPSARRIWDAIYLENCPKYSSGEICQEKKVLYKLISGLHTSISVHIAADYLLDENSNLWGQNHEVMYDRVLRYPDRVRNLYFTFLFVLRAVTKAADYLEFAEYDTGNYDEDLKTQSYMKQLLHHPTLQAACPLPFDEAKLWQDQSEPELKQQTQKQLRNISALMDCVGCEKCRLWGKLQVLGLGTALKILFSVDQNHLGQQLQLQRNEVIALTNLLHLLSESIKVVHEKGPLIEKIVEKQIYSPHTKFFIIWSTIWESLATLGYYTAYI